MISPTTDPEALDPPSGQLLLIDKPYEWTSFDVVNKLRHSIRRAYGLRKIKVGHAGTLDPLATGLLLICCGKMTKQIQDLTGLDKTYTGTFRLGQTTPSFDGETAVDVEYPIDHITPELLARVAGEMTGVQDQMPPVFSAKKVGGKRAYKAARKGVDVVLKSHRIEIFSFAITGVSLPEVHFQIRCSKGTYIRSIARDFGKQLGSGAFLTALKRTAVGPYDLSQAFDIEKVVALIGQRADTL